MTATGIPAPDGALRMTRVQDRLAPRPGTQRRRRAVLHPWLGRPHNGTPMWLHVCRTPIVYADASDKRQERSSSHGPEDTDPARR